MFPPNKSSTESETPVESRRKTEFTFTFSLKTNQGYGILGTPAFTEFCCEIHSGKQMNDYKFECGGILN